MSDARHVEGCNGTECNEADCNVCECCGFRFASLESLSMYRRARHRNLEIRLCLLCASTDASTAQEYCRDDARVQATACYIGNLLIDAIAKANLSVKG